MAASCSIDGVGPCCDEPVDRSARAAWTRIGIGAVIAVQSMTVDLALNTSEAAPGERAVAHALTALAAAATLALLGGPLFRNLAAAMRRRRITIEAMFMLGILGALAASAVAALTGTGAVYFEVSSLLLVVYALGQQLAGRARARAIRAVEAWAPESLECEVVAADGTVRRAAVAEVAPGDRVRVGPGTVIPVDGVIVAGEGFVREAEMTGEWFAAVRRPGERVWAGTVSLDALFTLRATSAGAERRIDRIVRAIEGARAVPARIEREADRLIGRFLPAVIAVAVLTFAGWAAARGLDVGLFNAMAVLLIACPCALGLATPLAVWAAAGRLAAAGVVVTDADAIERLARADSMVFDKTGTLTVSRPRLAALVAAQDGLPEAWVRGAVAAVERTSRHPVAAAFDGAGDEDAVEVATVRTLPGTGIAATVRDRSDGTRRTVTVGVAARVVPEDAGADWRALAARLPGDAGGHVIAVIVDGRPAAAALVGEEVRPTWGEARAALGGLGVHAAVVTGDAAVRAAALGVADTVADAGPEDKLARVRAMQADDRVVAVVGDGVNDAAAMAAADVAIAVGDGTDLAGEVAGLVWHGGDVRVIPAAVRICRETVRTIRSNLAFALVYNVVGIALAAAGMLHPVVAALLMTGSSLIVTWRAAGLAAGDQEAGAAAVATGLRTAEEVRG